MTSHHTDFDFFFGRWTVAHKRLAERLKNSTVWEEFSGSCETRPVLGGSGNVDDNILNFPGGAYRAITVRSFDKASKLWAIWWLDDRRPHSLDVPVVGAFENGIGTFECDDVLDGAPIKVRFSWSRQSPDNCRWQQAFSPDGGVTWETNWIMEFTRAS